MPTIKVIDIAWGRLCSPDLDRVKAGEGTRGPWGEPIPRAFAEHASP